MASAAFADFRGLDLPKIDPTTGLPIAAPFAAPVIPGMPGLPAYPGIAGVNELFDPNFGRTETITLGAENAIAGGFGMGGFGQNQTNRLLDSERKANFLAGHQILEPYLMRDFEAKENAANRASRLNEIAAEGAQALQRLQLSESGQGQRLSAELAARLQQQVLEGQQAMQQLTLREAGDTSRQREQIGGTLANTLLSGALAGRTGGTGSTAPVRYGLGNLSGPLGFNPVTASGTVPTTSSSAYNPAARGGGDISSRSFGLGSSSIDALLRKYNLL